MPADQTRSLSIVIPVLNDAPALAELLPRVCPLADEVLVVDGGSSDGVADIVGGTTARMLASAPSRGGQLRRGANAVTGDRVWLLHADSLVDPDAVRAVREADRGWGRLRLAFDTASAQLACVAWFMERRSRFTGICTGDQGIWVDRSLLEQVGGVPDQPLMEDVELSRRLRAVERGQVLDHKIVTAARRWVAGGVWRTVVSMWCLRLRYFAGADPVVLARRYYGR